MTFHSGFANRRQEDRYNQLLRDLLHMMSQMIITYVESSKVIAFRQAYQKLQYELSKMDSHKHSEFKVSLEIEPLTQHVLTADIVKQTFSEPPKKRSENRHIFRMKKTINDSTVATAKTIEVVQSQKKEKKRSYSLANSKKMLHSPSQPQQPQQQLVLSMEDLMRLNPLIERKMSKHHKRRYLTSKAPSHQHPPGDFPQIKEQEQQFEEINEDYS